MIGSGRDKGGSSAKGPQSWQNLTKPTKKRVNSPQAKKRRRQHQIKIAGAVLVGLAFVLFGVWGVAALREQEASIEIKSPSEKIERIIFNTNGVLPDDWIGRVLGLKSGTTMMEVDIYGLKAKIESYGQVKRVSVERVFPSDLQINIEEHIPVMRLAFESKDGTRSFKIVGADGSIYQGEGYPKSVLRELPFVMPYVLPDGSFEPMRGIEEVSKLIELAKFTQPKVYRMWDVISLQNYSGDLELPGQVIEVRSKLVPRILFAAAADYERQLERLVYIFKHVEAHGNPSMEVIDLSLNGPAAVQFSSETALELFNNAF
ncbi:MAG: FtsQ-type POTRA domain-containing protein [Verrucomicrobiota bacterium]